MEFDEMKKVWDSQNKEILYSINEKALHNRILSKKKTAHHITNFSELLAIITSISAGCVILGLNLFKQSGNVFMYLLAAWMLGSALYSWVSRIRRIRGDHRFDRSMLGDLSHAISVATYQVRFSQLMWWNIVPIGIFTLLAVWESGKSVWLTVGILIVLVLTNYAARWEHGIYKSRKRELEILQNKLKNEALGDRPS